MNEFIVNHQRKFCDCIVIIIKTIMILILISFIHWLIVNIYNIWCHDSSYWGIINNILKLGRLFALLLINCNWRYQKIILHLLLV